MRQKTVAIGSTSRAPVGNMPLIQMPFRRVVVDSTGPIAPASEKGHRYTLASVDYATRNFEAVPLTSMTTETVAEALRDTYIRFGVPEKSMRS